MFIITIQSFMTFIKLIYYITITFILLIIKCLFENYKNYFQKLFYSKALSLTKRNLKVS